MESLEPRVLGQRLILRRIIGSSLRRCAQTYLEGAELQLGDCGKGSKATSEETDQSHGEKDTKADQEKLSTKGQRKGTEGQTQVKKWENTQTSLRIGRGANFSSIGEIREFEHTRHANRFFWACGTLRRNWFHHKQPAGRPSYC